MRVQMISGTLSLGPTCERAEFVNRNEIRDPENPNRVINLKSGYHGENQKFGSEARNARENQIMETERGCSRFMFTWLRGSPFLFSGPSEQGPLEKCFFLCTPFLSFSGSPDFLILYLTFQTSLRFILISWTIPPQNLIF